jgi:hypothetical protein
VEFAMLLVDLVVKVPVLVVQLTVEGTMLPL